MYVRALNDRGGVNGSKIELIVLDDKAAPSEAASNAKRLMDDEQVLAVGQMSLSSTYAPMFQAAARTKTPVLILGMGVCPSNANTPQMNPYVFCGGSTSDPNTAAAWQVPLVKALGEKNKDKVKLALVAMDIPISRQGIDTDGKDRRHARRRGRRQAGDPAGGRRRQRCRGPHHLQGGELRDELCAGLDDGADARCAAPPGLERLVRPQPQLGRRGHAAPAQGPEAGDEPGICLHGREAADLRRDRRGREEV